jgi:hypothetical protein
MHVLGSVVGAAVASAPGYTFLCVMLALAIGGLCMLGRRA